MQYERICLYLNDEKSEFWFEAGASFQTLAPSRALLSSAVASASGEAAAAVCGTGSVGAAGASGAAAVAAETFGADSWQSDSPIGIGYQKND